MSQPERNGRPGAAAPRWRAAAAAAAAIDAAGYRSLSWHIAFHSQEQVPEAVVGNDVREYLTMFYPQAARLNEPVRRPPIEAGARGRERPG